MSLSVINALNGGGKRKRPHDISMNNKTVKKILKKGYSHYKFRERRALLKKIYKQEYESPE
jgi:hypothetical protein